MGSMGGQPLLSLADVQWLVGAFVVLVVLLGAAAAWALRPKR